MNFSTLIGPALGFVAGASVKSIIDDVVRLAVPPATKALTRYGLKLGTAAVGGVASMLISGFVVKNVSEIVETVKRVDENVESTETED